MRDPGSSLSNFLPFAKIRVIRGSSVSFFQAPSTKHQAPSTTHVRFRHTLKFMLKLTVTQQMRLTQIPWTVLACLRDVRRLGLFQACNFWIRSRQDRRFHVTAKAYDWPFLLRGKTSDAWVFHQLIVSDQYALLPESPIPQTILDAGANAGFGIRWMKRQWPDATVAAIEPDPENFRIAQANTSQLAGVTLIEGALWSEEGQASFVCEGDEKYALRVKTEEAGSIRCVSVCGLMRQMGWNRIDLIKMDIEGAEREVFGPSAQEWIHKVGVLVVELHEGVSPGCTVKLFQALQGTKFTLKWRGENLVVLFNSEHQDS